MNLATELITPQNTYRRFLKLSVFCMMILVSLNLPVYAQEKSAKPSWWIGIAGGANFNSYSGSTTQLNNSITVSPGFDKGHGVGAYAGVVIEFRCPNSMLGAMLQQGLDNRRADFEQAGKEFELKLSYYTVEPSLVITPSKRSSLYFYVGPRFGFLWHTTFEYKQPNQPDYPNDKDPDPQNYFKNLRKNPVTMQVGLGYNIAVSPAMAKHQCVISPFVTYLPSLGSKNIRTIESLKSNTIRAGIIIKAGCNSAL